MPPLETEQVQEVVKLTVHETLTGIGFNMNRPIEVQKDIQHMSKSRVICEKIQMVAITVAVSTVASGVLYAVWNAVTAAE